MSQCCYNEYNSKYCQNHGNFTCCCCDCEKPKVKGKFGLAFVLETPERKCVQPCGWQVELCGTPSSIEHTCTNMLEWVKCPPLSENETIKIDDCTCCGQIPENCCNCYKSCGELCNNCCTTPNTTCTGIKCLINKFENMSYPCKNCSENKSNRCECFCEPNILECCRTTKRTHMNCCCSTGHQRNRHRHKVCCPKKKVKVKSNCGCEAPEHDNETIEKTPTERTGKWNKGDYNSTSNELTENDDKTEKPVKDKKRHEQS